MEQQVEAEQELSGHAEIAALTSGEFIRLVELEEQIEKLSPVT